MPSGGTLDSLGAHFDPIAESARKATEAVNTLRQDLGAMQSQVTQNSQQIASVIATLNGNMDKISSSVERIASGMKRGASETSKTAATIDDLWKAYKQMGVEVDALNLDLNTLKFTQAELNKVVKLGNDYNTQRETSYNSLSEKYRAMKILFDNMTQSELQNTEAGKKFTAQLKEMYDKMNMLQQSTGKYQLQVGNYSKAMNGLNIATQQVIREMPVLAQSTQMFVMAISNNVPILLDQVKIFQNTQTELKKTKTALLEQAAAAEAAGNAAEAAAIRQQAAVIKTTTLTKALAATIFSWQTAVVLVLTVLPNIIKKLKEKQKAQADLNEVLQKTIDLDKQIADGDLKAEQRASSETAKLRTLYAISQDTNRSLAERKDAVTALQQEFPSYFENLSQEVILQGNATTAYNKATEALIKRAKAQAYLDEITKTEKDKLEYEKTYTEERAKLVKEIGEKEQEVASLAPYYKPKAGNPILNVRFTKAGIELEKMNKELEQMDANARSFLTNSDKYIDDLIKKIDASGFIEEEKGGRGRNRESKSSWGFKIAKLDTDIYGEEVQRQKDSLEAERNVRDIAIRTEYDQRKAAGEDIITLQKERDARLIESEKEYWKEYLNLLTKSGTLTLNEYESIMAKLQSFDKGATSTTASSSTTTKRRRGKKFGGVASALAAYSGTYGDTETIGGTDYKIVAKEYEKYFSAIDTSITTSISYMKEWMDTRIEMAQVAVEAAEKEMDSAKTLLDYEMQARANGYANNVEYAQKEYEKKRSIAEKAAQDVLELQRVQEIANTAQQVSSLVTATANIWSAEGIKGLAGVPLAVAATAAMWASFTAAKVRAAQLTAAQTEKYGEGMSEYLDYGGSHASGHDIDFGVKPDGTRRRVERGEMIGVINKRNVNKYGVKQVSDIISALNKGEFEQRYGNAFSYGIVGGTADLTRLEKGVSNLVEQGQTRVVSVNGKTIAYYKNTKRIIRS